MQKLLSLIRSHLFISAFVSLALGDRSKKKIIATIYIKECSAYLLFWEFMASGLILSLFLYTV